VGSGVPVTVREIAETIGELTGRGELIDFGAFKPRPGDPPMVVADNRKLRKATGWTPKYDLRSGLEHTVQWWREELTRRGELKS
jgi:nucleoside-diphosphate-sugar epimerase